MTRTEKRNQKDKEKMLQSINLIFIFVAIASLTFGFVVNDENKRIKEKINKFNPDVKVFYLQEDIKGGKY